MEHIVDYALLFLGSLARREASCHVINALKQLDGEFVVSN